MNNTEPARAIAKFINRHPLATVSTLLPNGKPHGTTVYIGSDHALNLYFMTKNSTTKAQNISINGAVSVTIGLESPQATLQLHGEAQTITNQAEGQSAFEVLGAIKRDSDDFRLPITKFGDSSYVVYKIVTSDAILTQYSMPDLANGISKIEYNL